MASSRAHPSRAAGLVLAIALAIAGGCDRGPGLGASSEGAAPAQGETEPGPGETSPGAGGGEGPAPAESAGPKAGDGAAKGAPEAPAPVDARIAASASCPPDMRLVEGSYCPAVQEKCAARKQLDPRSEPQKNNCQTYVEPTVCLTPTRREPMRFCMDTYEWPNQKGAKPRVLVSWQDARELCASRGKRLCSEPEWGFACEGEAMRPYVYGFERDPGKCNIDRPYRPRTFTFTPWDTCMADPACKAAFDAIDQRWPAGSNEGCRSPEGIYDLNGNVNEWVSVPGAKSPRRSGLKGGWWGPVRNRCRPTVRFHDEGDYGYEVGFRCCADAR
jgi:hypothetical protein